MTEDELDLLASAYLDGEATPEEVALVEREPQLLARVEALRVVSGQVAGGIQLPDPAVKEQHLAAALAAFSAPTSADAAPVIDLAERVERPRSAVRSTTRSTREAPRRSMPRWLPAAAALLLIGGAGAVIFSQGFGGGDDFDSADAGAGDDTAEAAEEGESAEADFDAATEAESNEAAMSEMVSDDDEAMEEEAMEDDEEAMEDESADSDAGGAGEEGATGGFFPREPLLRFLQTPTVDEVLLELDRSLLMDPLESTCGDFVVPEAGTTVAGYAVVEVEGETAEFFIEVDGDGGERGVLLTVADCGPITP